MVIRKHSGKAYGEFLHDRIFAPLGMSDTRIISHRDVIANRASGYSFDGGKLRNGQFVAESILGYGGGGVVSTAPDMAKWAIAVAGGKILKKETIEQAWTAGTLTDGSATQYGLGWGLGGTEGHRFVGHGGAHMTGFTSNLTIFRDDGIAVVVLTNAGHANPGNIARQIAAVYEPALAPPRRKAIEDKAPKVTERVRQIGERFRDGQARADDFTPVLWALLSPQLKDLQAAGQADGELKSIELLSMNATGEDKTYHYRMTFAKRVHLVRVTINGDGKVSGLWAEEE
jgi:CubicO group peptidase (beta-lactamase class C family)